jgi:hypothetical protein
MVSGVGRGRKAILKPVIEATWGVEIGKISV